MGHRKLSPRVVILNPHCLVGEKLRCAREQAGLSQIEMAVDVNKTLQSIGAIAVPLNRSAISRLETGERGLKHLEAWAIAQVLDVKVESFFP